MITLPRLFVAALLLLLFPVALLWLFGERWRPIRPSTIAWFQSAGLKQLPQALHGYVYARWSNQYIGTALRHMKSHDRRFQHNSADHYHGKVLPHDLARQLVTLDHPVNLLDYEHVIPYPVARDIVIRNPEAIAVYDCPCRLSRENPCLPLDVCMIIGQPWVDFLVEHNPLSTRRISQDEALEILEAEHRRGHVHTAYFKDAMESRFYAICNCCKCCCGGIEAMMRGGVPMVCSSGYVARIDADACIACGTCEEACPFGAIHVNGTAVVDTTRCMGCGVCGEICDLNLPELVRDERKPAPLDLAALEAVEANLQARSAP